MNREIKEISRENSKIVWSPIEYHSFQWSCSIPIQLNISVIIIKWDKGSPFRNTERKKEKREKRKEKGNTTPNPPIPPLHKCHYCWLQIISQMLLNFPWQVYLGIPEIAQIRGKVSE